MRCEDATDRLFNLASDNLLSKDPQVLAHLERCRECRETVARAARAWSLPGAASEPVADSTAMRERFDAFLENELTPAPCVVERLAAEGGRGCADRHARRGY